MGWFRESPEKIQRVGAVWDLARACEGKSFVDLCLSKAYAPVTDLWAARPTGPWNLRFLLANLATLAQLTARKKLKLRTYGSLFEVGSSAVFRTENDSFEILAGDVLGVLYQASLQIYRPADSLVLASHANQIHADVYWKADGLSRAKGPQLVQILKERLRDLDADPKTYLHSRTGLRSRRDVAESLSNLVCNARKGLERLRGAYAAKEDHRSLVDKCVSVARKIESQDVFQFMELECVIDRSLSIAAIKKLGVKERDGLVNSPKKEGVSEGFYPVREVKPQGVGLAVGIKEVYLEKKPLLKQADLKQAAPETIEPVWEGDMSDLNARQRLNQSKFRKICEAPIFKTAIVSSRLISEEKKKKSVRFADAESRPLVWALSVNMNHENAALDKKLIAAGAKTHADIGYVPVTKYPDKKGKLHFADVNDQTNLPPKPISDHDAAKVAAELVRELKRAYCQSPIEEEVFSDVADSLVGEGSMDGDG